MPNGLDFFGNPNQWATDYGRAQHQAEREAAEAKRQARAWQAHAQELEAAYNAMKAQRDELYIHRETWKETIREMAAQKMVVTLDVANAIYDQKEPLVVAQKKSKS